MAPYGYTQTSVILNNHHVFIYTDHSPEPSDEPPACKASEDANAKRLVKVPTTDTAHVVPRPPVFLQVCRSTFGRCYPDSEDVVHAVVKKVVTSLSSLCLCMSVAL